MRTPQQSNYGMCLDYRIKPQIFGIIVQHQIELTNLEPRG